MALYASLQARPLGRGTGVVAPFGKLRGGWWRWLPHPLPHCQNGLAFSAHPVWRGCLWTDRASAAGARAVQDEPEKVKVPGSPLEEVQALTPNLSPVSGMRWRWVMAAAEAK